MDTKEKNTCPVCESQDIYNFITIEQVPLFCNVLLPTYKEAIAVQKGDLRMCFCKECAHVFNDTFDPELMSYTQTYENALDFSPRFKEYAQSLAHYLIDQYDLHDKDIIEIGCGKGDFLLLLCQLGKNRGIGFDPSYEPRINGINDTNDVTFIQDYYTDHYSHYKGDFICCRHALEHIQRPTRYLKDIRHIIGNHKDSIVFFEVPHVLYTLKDLGIWDLIYAHCSYFTARSLTQTFSRAGFEVLNLREVFAGQNLTIESRPIIKDNDYHSNDIHSIDSVTEHISTFKQNYFNKVDYWVHQIETIREKSQRAVIWGGGSKGVTFSNCIKSHNVINYIVDINPHKRGKYVPGTGQQIISPEFLKDYNPDIVIVMNSIYLDEIQQNINQMNLSSTILTV